MNLIPSTFSTYALSEEELKSGVQFSSSQKGVIQNLIADLATQKLGLEFDTAAPQQFIQQEAFLAGQIKILQYLLSLSETE